MPRRSKTDYLRTRTRLANLWQSSIQVFGYLSHGDQRSLHDYFAFTLELIDADALAYRVKVTAAQPTLPQRAGQAMRRLEIVTTAWVLSQQRQAAARSSGARKQSTRQLTVHGVLRPQPDYQLLVRTLMEFDAGQHRKGAA